VAKKPSRSRKLNLYSNLSHNHRTKKDLKSRKKAQYLASLPKHPVERFLYRLNPKHLWKYWTSKEGGIMALKIVGITILSFVLLVGALFIFYRKDLDAIRPGELAKRVETTATTYLDRNGNVLWVDTGTGSYKLVVPDSGLNKYMKQATVAIEDKNFYNEGGISISGTIRAVINNITGGSTQGGSTLTQQLVKQVFFTNQAQQRGLAGIPRKIKEIILSIEVERMYDKNQILDLYLNESPYGGRRNGAESAAQTYFGISAKDLTLPEAALLAAIPQDPSYFNPYNVPGNADLIERQHTVLDNMVSQGYITKAQADTAKAYPILDHITPEADQYANIKAPHFVQMVRSELISELGSATVGNGGLTVKTTLDLRIQNKLQQAMDTEFNSYIPAWAGFSDGAGTVEDVKTGQILALLGSRDYNYPGFGQDNAAIAYIQPGSSIKPLVYSQLFQQKPAGQVNYGSGSTLNDTNIDSIYGAVLRDDDNRFEGPITVRSALATSRNIPAVDAMYISGVKTTIDTIHKMGATSYCTQGTDPSVGLAAAIGGCGIKQVDLVNAYATLARQGVYKPQSSILSVTNSSGEVLKKWTDTAGVQVISPQSAYIVSNILNDDVARRPLDGYHALGMYMPGIPTATKTGTSDKNGYAKDIWMASYSPEIAMAVWFGNSDASILKNGTSALPGAIINTVMTYAHEDVYGPAGLWKSNEWFSQPAGIQVVNNQLYPSWWNKTQGQTTKTLTFDKVSKKLATSLTPQGAQIQLTVSAMIDPITKKTVYIAPDGYNASESDDVHKASDVMPTVDIAVDSVTKNSYMITATASAGTFPITGIQISVGGAVVTTLSGSGTYTYNVIQSDASKPVTATVTDSAYYTAPSPEVVSIPAYQ
jgi:penicillin-binding protein 1A